MTFDSLKDAIELITLHNVVYVTNLEACKEEKGRKIMYYYHVKRKRFTMFVKHKTCQFV